MANQHQELMAKEILVAYLTKNDFGTGMSGRANPAELGRALGEVYKALLKKIEEG